MKVLILGAGILGVTTAYELGRRGYDVTVVERKDECARETSYANGGQLSYSHGEPWATPGVLKKLPKWLIDPNSPVVFRLRFDPDMVSWTWKFLLNCTHSKADLSTVNLLRLGLYSRDEMEKLRLDSGIAFDFDKKGTLHIFGNQKDLDDAKAQSDYQTKFGAIRNLLTRDECIAFEPALAHTQRTIVGGLHAVQDETGDPFLYCCRLAKLAEEKYGVKFLFNTTVQNIRMQNQVISAVTTDKGDLTADGYVMCLSAYSTPLLKTIGIKVPIYPMKGYSITLKANEFGPQSSITDGTHKIVYTKLGDRMRVAGTAEFGGFNNKVRERRIAPILRLSKETFPKLDWGQEISKWACLRPSTPDGPPIIGRTPVTNLFLNTGHGTLGWTQAAGSTALLADIMEGKPTGILPHGLTLERFL